MWQGRCHNDIFFVISFSPSRGRNHRERGGESRGKSFFFSFFFYAETPKGSLVCANAQCRFVRSAQWLSCGAVSLKLHSKRTNCALDLSLGKIRVLSRGNCHIRKAFAFGNVVKFPHFSSSFFLSSSSPLPHPPDSSFTVDIPSAATCVSALTAYEYFWREFANALAKMAALFWHRQAAPLKNREEGIDRSGGAS